MPGDASRRNGALGGRPISTKRLIAEKMRERLAERLFKKADATFDAWEDLALGHFVLIEDPLTGSKRIYKKSPNGQAIKDMFEHVVGKPRQPIDVNIEDEPRYDMEALQRMGKYVEPTDAEFTELNAGASKLPASAITITHAPAFAVYSLRGVGERLATRPTNPAKRVDKNNAKEQS